MVLRRLKRTAEAAVARPLHRRVLERTGLSSLAARLSILVERLRPTRPAPRGRPLSVLFLIDLVQDLEVLLPIMKAARAAGRFHVDVCMTTWLHRVSPWIPDRLAVAGFRPLEAQRERLLDPAGVSLRGFDALVTASESTAAAHRHGHALVRRANRLGLATLTVQHGLENLGLTSRVDGDHAFASKTILTWGPAKALPDWLPRGVRARCVGVGRPRSIGAAPEPLPPDYDGRRVVAVFENLHWARYSAEYADRFLHDLAGTARAFPDVLFLIKPHPAGLWLTRNLGRLDSQPDNLVLADPNQAAWSQVTAVALITAATCVVTTPSTVALDAVEAGRPVAVAAYGLDLEAYDPLPALQEEADWTRFVRSVLDGSADTASRAQAFRRRHLMDGDAATRALDAIECAVPRRSAAIEALAAVKRQLLQPVRQSTPTPFEREYLRWIAACDTVGPEDEARIRAAFDADAPRVAILIDPRVGGWRAVRQSLRSARAQWYPALTVRVRSLGPKALDGLEADLLLPMPAGLILPPHAIASLVAALRERPDAAFAYGDEDALGAGGSRVAPYFKGAFNIDLLLAQDFASTPSLHRLDEARARGGLPAGSPRAAIYGLTLRMAEAGPVVHTPFVLAHRPPDTGGTEEREAGAMAARAAEALMRLEPRARIEPVTKAERRVHWPMPEPAPLVSLIIPTRDRTDLLEGCVEGLLHETDYPRLEILIIDNDSVEPATHAYLTRASKDSRVRVLPHPGAFNYSAINNRAAEQAHGSLIGLINNDLKVMEPEWLRTLVAQAARAHVGAVGPMLYYGDGAVQHAGCVLGMGGVASHVLKGSAADARGPGGRLALAQEVSAVTGACLITSTDLWRALGGLDEDLAVAYNDIDYCLRVREAGRRVIWTPHARLFHLESATRGEDKSGERRERLEREKAKMYAKWGAVLEEDPFFSPNLSIKRADCWPAFPPRQTPFWRRES